MTNLENEKSPIYQRDIRRRNWIFVENNPTMSEQKFYDMLKSWTNVKYFIFRREKGEKGTEHFQGYIEFSQPVGLMTLHNRSLRTHFEQRRGSKTEARDYVLKVGKYADKADTVIGELMEFGEFVESGERSDLTAMMDAIKDGASFTELSERFQSKYAVHMAWAEKYRQELLAEEFSNKIRDLEVTYLWGDAGSGKSLHVVNKYGLKNIFRMTNYGKNGRGELFDGYKGQDVIVFEEFRSSIALASMLNYLDIYPLELPARYQNKVACYTKVYIISNIPIEEQYSQIREKQFGDWRAFRRRIHHVMKINTNVQQSIDDLPRLNDNTPLPF